MKELHIFTDGSVDNASRVGFGACLVLRDLHASLSDCKSRIECARFTDTSSTRLELQIFLWALDNILASDFGGECIVTMYTDSQNIVNLPSRRARLEGSNYITKKNTPIANETLYRRFYQRLDLLRFRVVQLQGHKKSSQKSKLDHIFSLVDQASRNALRQTGKV